jgi:hypothetical protein
MSHRARLAAGWLLALLFLVSCGTEALAPADALAAVEQVGSWSAAGEVQTFDHDSLYDLVDGQADAFFVYAFERVAVQTFKNAQGAVLRVEVWETATPADAYGLFTTYRSGTSLCVTPASDPAFCAEADMDPGRRLGFWQDRYNVRLFAFQPVPDADLVAVAEAISEVLPADSARPSIVDRLPQEGLIGGSAIFFREELSIQDYVWLGGQNLLGLSPETEGVLARYQVDDGIGQLILILYPETDMARRGMERLAAGQIGSLVSVQTRERLLVAVFGNVGQKAADDLISAVLAK